MQFRLVAGFFSVPFRELGDFDRPRHTARAQHIDDTEVVEAHSKAELLKAAGVLSGGNFGLH